MYYFFHGTSFESFKNIIKTKYILASFYLKKNQKKYIRMNNKSKFVFTNIYVDGLPLQSSEKGGLGSITFIINPVILKYKKCYFNNGWLANIDNSIIINNNIDNVIEYLKHNYKYPYIMTHEALFEKSISMNFVIGIICNDEYKNEVKKYLKKYGYQHIKIFNKFPTLKKNDW